MSKIVTHRRWFGCQSLTILTASVVLATIGLVAPARAAITFNVSFNDPGNAFAAYYADITSHALAAGNDWGSRLVSNTPSSLEIIVNFPNIPRASGRSMVSSFFGTVNGTNIFEQGAAAEIKTGIDPNGAAPDIEINFGSDYLMNELWFDPNPLLRTAPVPINRTDAYSVFIHEVGHALSFNGFRDVNGTPPPSGDLSTYDQFIKFNNINGENIPFFTGSAAVAEFGADVPLTFGNMYHVGNAAPRPGEELIPDMMNGVVYFRGVRYNISALDLAITQDAGLPVLAAVVPESSTLLLGLLGMGALGGMVVRRRMTG